MKSDNKGIPAPVTWLDERFYRGYSDNWDNRYFREYILKHLACSDLDFLDYGAGRGAVEEMNFCEIARFVAGVDPDPAVLENPFLDDAKILPLPSGRIPYADASFDVVFSNSVLEHVTEPHIYFAEAHRVLRSGGVMFVKTPNLWHYVPVIARLTPYKAHRYVNRKRGRRTVDTFPTVYRCNTPCKLKDCARKAGFEIADLQLVEGRPEYLRWSVLTYLLGFFYERTVNASPLLSCFRCVLISSFCKK